MIRAASPSIYITIDICITIKNRRPPWPTQELRFGQGLSVCIYPLSRMTHCWWVEAGLVVGRVIKWIAQHGGGRRSHWGQLIGVVESWLSGIKIPLERRRWESTQLRPTPSPLLGPSTPSPSDCCPTYHLFVGITIIDSAFNLVSFDGNDTIHHHCGFDQNSQSCCSFCILFPLQTTHQT